MRDANWMDILVLRLGLCERYLVEGDSMLPTLKSGDQVSVMKPNNLQIGDIVVAKHPYRTTPIIKRIANISSAGKVFLKGDNPDPLESSDSRNFGEIPHKDVVGKVVCKLN